MLLPFTNAVVPDGRLAGGRVVIELPQEVEATTALAGLIAPAAPANRKTPR